MSDAAASLLKRLQQSRLSWVDLEPGKALQIERPAEADFFSFARNMGSDLIASYVRDWRGFTVGDVIGPEDDCAADPAPFAPDLCSAVLRDHVDWLNVAAQALSDLIKAHIARREAAQKN